MPTLTKLSSTRDAQIQELYTYAYRILENMIYPTYGEAREVLKQKIRCMGGAPALEDLEILAAVNFLGFALRTLKLQNHLHSLSQ